MQARQFTSKTYLTYFLLLLGSRADFWRKGGSGLSAAITPPSDTGLICLKKVCAEFGFITEFCEREERGGFKDE